MRFTAGGVLLDGSSALVAVAVAGRFVGGVGLLFFFGHRDLVGLQVCNLPEYVSYKSC